jgi:hypothetical protein
VTTVEHRAEAVAAFGQVLGPDVADTFSRLLPTRPWSEAEPRGIWLRQDVLSRMDEGRRRGLHNRLIEVLGARHAGVLMAFIPPLPPATLERYGITI